MAGGRKRLSSANAEADALRRDFTVNGLFYDPLTEKIHDWVGGEKDLRAKIIRTIGAPEERFGEDHLRLLRAVRFAAQLDFEIEPKTFAAIKSLAPKIKLISAERIRDELLKLFRPPHAARGLGLLARQRIAGTDSAGNSRRRFRCEQSPDYHPEGNVFDHIRLMLEKLPADAARIIAVGGAAARHRQAGDGGARRRRPARSIFTATKKSARKWRRHFATGCNFHAKQTDEIAAAVLHHMQFKDVKQMRKWPRCGGCCCARHFRWNWNCTGWIASARTASWTITSFLRAGGRIEKQTGDPSAAAHRRRFDPAWHETRPRDGRAAGRSPRKTTLRRTQDCGRSARMGENAAQEFVTMTPVPSWASATISKRATPR